MKFLCYAVYDGNPERKEPISHCAMGEDGSLTNGSTLEELKTNISTHSDNPEFLEGCGWIIDGEQQKLLDPSNAILLKFNLFLREQKLEREKANDKKI